MINLFEYRNTETLDASAQGLDTFLDEIWRNRETQPYYRNEGNVKKSPQRFLQLLKDNHVRSNKYVGIIRYNGLKINLLPKIFYDEDKYEGQGYSEQDVWCINNHILWWLSYCRKIRFPKYVTSMGNTKSDFFEMIIYMFAKYTRELLGSSIYQNYEEIHRELSCVRGRIDINPYIKRNLSTGRWHKVSCSYESFEFDNAFNRIIKHVVRLLYNVTELADNKKQLREILFILDEVSDVHATAKDCEAINFNPMFGEYEVVRDYCSLFLSNSVSFSYKNDMKLFAFLLPMEYVFEDFIYGFIDRELTSVKAKSQVSGKSLVSAPHPLFALKPDLVLTVKTKEQETLTSKTVIADTKYKIVNTDASDSKKGISQNDLYQVLAYATRFKLTETYLFYPNTIQTAECEETFATFTIEDALAGKNISVKASCLPIIDKELLGAEYDRNISLEKLFEPARERLKVHLMVVFEECP